MKHRKTKKISAIMLVVLIVINLFSVTLMSATASAASYDLGKYSVAHSNGVMLRSGPGTSYARLGAASIGTEFNVSYIEYSGGYSWGYTDSIRICGSSRKTAAWVALDFCSYKGASRTATEIWYSSMTVPSTISAGSSFNLGGTISSTTCNLTYFTGEILNAYGQTVLTETEYVYSDYVNIRNSRVNTRLKFGTLGAGSYTLKYTAVASDNTTKTASYSFVVKSNSVTVTGNSNEERVFNFLVNEMGYNRAAACGVLSNIRSESNFRTGAYGDGGDSYGICQWHNSRFTALKRYCKNNGLDYTTLAGQLAYLKYELTTEYAYNIHNYLRSVPNTAQGAYDAAYKFCFSFERPANTAYVSSQRGNYAKNTYWNKYA